MLTGTVVAIRDDELGAELSQDELLGATTLHVDSTDDFDELGGTLVLGGTTYTYASVDDGALTITGVAALSAGALAGDWVAPYPAARIRVASVELSEGEVVDAVVPHYLYPLLDAELRDAAAERVAIEERGLDWIVLDVLGREPTIDGTLITAGTVTAEPTDGLPPTSSPTPELTGTIGALVAKWPAITNADPVTYEVHLGTTSGFTVSSSTKVAEITGTILWIRKAPDGSDLEYGQDYFAKVVAKDLDGAHGGGTFTTPTYGGSYTASAAAQLVEVNTADIAAEAIHAEQIFGGTITADKLAATLLLASTILTAEAGARVEVSTAGITLYNSSGDILVQLPTDDASDPSFRGTIQALGLTVLDALTLRAPQTAGKKNVIEAGATVILENALSDPSTAPALASAWDTITLADSQYSNESGRRGLHYTTDGGTAHFYFLASRFSGDPYAVVETDAAGAFSREIELASNYIGLGVARVSGSIFVLARDTDGTHDILKYDASTLALTSTTPLGVREPGVTAGSLAFGASATDLYIVYRTTGGGGPAEFAVQKWTTTPSWTSSTTTDYNPANDFLSPTGIYVGNGDFGVERWVVSITDSAGIPAEVQVFSNLGVRQANDSFPTPNLALGVAYDGTRFWTLQPHYLKKLAKHTTWKWTTESDHYWLRYTWIEDNSTGLGDPGAWAASTNYALGDRRRPTGVWTAGTTDVFEVVADAGSSGASEPTWPTTPGATVVDGGITWTLRNKESLESPQQGIIHKKRAKLRVTTADLPADVTHVGIYTDRGATAPAALDFQVASAVKTVDLEDFTAGGQDTPTTSSFPNATPARFETSDGNPLLTALGLSRCTLSYAGAHTLNDSQKEWVTFGTETQDTDGYHDDSAADALGTTPGTTAEQTFPFTGQYLAFIRVTFGASAAGRREIGVETDRTGSFADFETFSFPPASGGGTRIAFPVVIDDVTAGDKMRIYLFQTSGIGLTINNVKLSLFYIGPTE